MSPRTQGGIRRLGLLDRSRHISNSNLRTLGTMLPIMELTHTKENLGVPIRFVTRETSITRGLYRYHLSGQASPSSSGRRDLTVPNMKTPVPPPAEDICPLEPFLRSAVLKIGRGIITDFRMACLDPETVLPCREESVETRMTTSLSRTIDELHKTTLRTVDLSRKAAPEKVLVFPRNSTLRNSSGSAERRIKGKPCSQLCSQPCFCYDGLGIVECSSM